jgi:putative isomerase
LNDSEAYERIYGYLEEHVGKVLKKPVGFISHPFIDPGSVYDGNVWDWDTYWSVYGLLPLSDRLKGGALREQILTHAIGNVQNFLEWQLPDGYIPMMIENGKWPEPYLNIQHKNGYLMNMHKPFLCQQISLISEYRHDYSWIFPELAKIEKYFACYDRNYFNENCGLYTWCDDIMIGMDNDPASFGRPKFSTANIFLNAFMVMELEAARKIFTAAAQPARAEAFAARREQLIRALHEECYDPRDGFYYSVDTDVKTRPYDWFHQGLGVFWKSLPIRIAVWSGFLPMLAGFATKEEAEALREHFHDEAQFGSRYGIPTLDKREKMFDLRATNNPSNWLGPVWLVANYCVFRGMLNYGFREEAEEMCTRSLRLLGNDLQKTGCLHEYYNPFTGEPVMNGGFINWNILALNMADELKKGGRPMLTHRLF